MNFIILSYFIINNQNAQLEKLTDLKTVVIKSELKQKKSTAEFFIATIFAWFQNKNQ